MFDNNEDFAVADVVCGGPGDDKIWTGAGDDQLFGGPGNDRLWGEAGDDRLVGGAGNDILNGGPEDDDLWGEAGRDICVFRDDFDYDTVHDFTLGQDQLRIVGFARSHLTLLPATGSDTVIRVVSTKPDKDGEQTTLKNFVAADCFLDGPSVVLADGLPEAFLS